MRTSLLLCSPFDLALLALVWEFRLVPVQTLLHWCWAWVLPGSALQNGPPKFPQPYGEVWKDGWSQ